MGVVVACLALIGAAMIAVAGGSAGNRPATTPFEFLPGDSFTYGENVRHRGDDYELGPSMFTQLEVHARDSRRRGIEYPGSRDAPRLVLWRRSSRENEAV